MPGAATYKVKRKALGSRDLPPLVDKLATFVGEQTHGSLGWFEGPTIEPVTGSAMPEPLRRDGIVFAWLPDGERVCVVQGAVVLVNPGGKCRLVAPSIEAFALAWAKGASGVPPTKTSDDHDATTTPDRAYTVEVELRAPAQPRRGAIAVSGFAHAG